MPQLPSAQDANSPVETLSAAQDFAVGQWYWVKDTDSKGAVIERLACVTEIGSNYVQLHAPSRHGHYCMRVHYTDYHTDLRREMNAGAAIAEKVTFFQKRIAERMEEVKAITARLGVNPAARLSSPSGAETKAVALVSSATDPRQYEKALILAEKEQLPALFKEIKEDSEQLAKWMKAELLPLEAMTGELEGSMKVIKDRIFNVSLYAGLDEGVKKCRDGAPADFHEKLHVMQKRLYMDEQCFFAYETGGIDISGINDFDAFLSKPDNFRSIFPFPRTVVAFRVRREQKEREWDGSLSSIYVNMQLSDADRLTFLYIRNGDQLWRLNCKLDFGELIFPSEGELNPSEPLMMNVGSYKRFEFMTVREYDDRKSAEVARRRNFAAWEKANPQEGRRRTQVSASFSIIHDINPYGGDSFSFEDWVPFDEGSVYFDDARKKLAEMMQKYNRVALLLQGLFDRSECLHPHPPVKTWTPEGFAAAVQLVPDGSNVLFDGDPPDFEAYIAECNAKITKDSVLWGQDLYWQQKEAERESKRLDNDWRNRSEYRPKLFKPYGNPGPGVLARPAEWKPKAKEAVFTWTRERLRPPTNSWDPDGPIRTSIAVPVAALFNVSAYRPGDFRRFFADSRTRQQYLKWGPMLIAAEEYHAGNSKMPVQDPYQG